MTDTSVQLTAANGIKVIGYSLRCFWFSLASLVPVLGLPFALVALANYRKARAVSKGCWNPARSLLVCGTALSGLGLLISSFVILLFVAWCLKMLPGQYS